MAITAREDGQRRSGASPGRAPDRRARRLAALALAPLGALTLATGAAAATTTAPAPSTTTTTAPSSPARAPSATTGAVSGVTPTTATVTGAVNPNGAATSFTVQYGLGTSTTYTSSTPAKSVGDGTKGVSVTATIPGLSPATSYRYRIVATSSGGTSDGANGVFNTSAAPAVETGAAGQVGAASAQLTGSVNPEGLATSWYFEYGTSTSYGSKTAATSMAAGPNPVNVSTSLSGLSPHTTYHFRLVATSSAGTSLGSDATFTTDLSVSLNSSTSTVVYGRMVRLSGTVASGKSGVQVQIKSQRFNQGSFSTVAAVTTSSGGRWQYLAQPTARTTYEAEAGGGTSSPVLVSVSPAVFLSRLRTGNLETRVVAATSFASHVLQLQKLEHGLWVTWKHVRLDSVGRAVFATSLPVGRTPVRMAIGPFVPGINQAGPGYLAGYSISIIYVRGR